MLQMFINLMKFSILSSYMDGHDRLVKSSESHKSMQDFEYVECLIRLFV